MNAGVTLVLGGAGSGKSLYAENLMNDYPDCLYIATAEARDRDMQHRIHKHQQRRGEQWQLIEEKIDIAEIIAAKARPKRPLLVDCLTLWLANLLETENNPELAFHKLAEVLKSVTGPVVLVSNEVGLGGIAATAETRKFMDHQGRLNQVIANVADRVILVIAGQALTLKETS